MKRILMFLQTVFLALALSGMAFATPITVYNCTALTGGGTRSLDSLSVDDLADGYRAHCMVSNVLTFFLFDADGTDAEDVSNHPYKVRPDDYVDEGVWIEQQTPPDIVLDTTPQLGGNLDADSKDITGINDIAATGQVVITGIPPAAPMQLVMPDGNSTKLDFINATGNVSIGTDGNFFYIWDAGVKIMTIQSAGGVPAAYIGQDDVLRGALALYGNTTGSDDGGRLSLYMAADYDTTDERWQIRADEDDLLINLATSGEVARFTAGKVLGLKGSFVQYSPVTLDTTDGAGTHTITEMLGGLIVRSGITAGREDDTDTAANIVAAISGAVVNQSFDFYIQNNDDASAITLDGGVGVTIYPNDPSNAINAGSTGCFRAVLTNVTAASEAVTVYCLGISTH